VATIFLPEASTPETGTLDAANLAQEDDEALRWDLLASSHLQRRRPFRRCLSGEPRQGRADQK